MTRLVLFDIDGTILSAKGAPAKVFRQALEEVFGTSGPLHGYSFSGRTDPQIARDLLLLAGLPEAEIDAGMGDVWRRYIAKLEREIERVDVTVYPGVRELIDRLEAVDEAVLGLLTGNIAEGARVKLGAAGIDIDRFRIAAFGSDHRDRNELPAIATQRAEEVVGRRFAGKEVVIIGDTPHDISCGEHLGVRTIAVATGSPTYDELAACNPDYLFENLADVDAVWAAIFD